MNFLQICQKVNQFVGLQGTFSSAKNATGYQKRLADTVVSCWKDIQNYRQSWLFNQRDTSFSTVVGKTEYTINDIFGTTVSPIRSVNSIVRNDNQLVLSKITQSEYVLKDLEHDPQQKVAKYMVHPTTQSIWLPTPDEVVSLQLFYYSNLQELVEDTDEPYLPSAFHNVLVYKAAAETALMFGSSDIYMSFDKKYNYELGALLRSQNPTISIQVTA